MKTEQLNNYFNKIKEITGGDNTSNIDIIDYKNGNSITKDELRDEYYKYLELQEEIDEYVDENDLDDVLDAEKIKNHFSNIDESLFELNQGCLKTNFVDFMVCKIEKRK